MTKKIIPIFTLFFLFSTCSLVFSQTINLISNPSFETDVIYPNDHEKLPDNWNFITNYPNNYQWTDDVSKFGHRSLQVTTYESTGGCVTPLMDIKSGTTYTFSYYFKTNKLYDYTAKAAVNEYNISGNRIRIDAETCTPTGDWQRISVTFSPLEDTVKIKAYAIVYPNGTEQNPVISWIDGAQLEEGSTTSEFIESDNGMPPPVPTSENIIRNPSFEILSPALGIPSDWTPITNYKSEYNLATNDKVCGQKSLMAIAHEGVAGVSSNFVNVEPNTKYVLSAYIKVDDPEIVQKGLLAYKAYDNSFHQLPWDYQNITLYSGWQRIVYSFITDSFTKYLSVFVQIISDPQQIGKGWMDCIQLEKGVYPALFNIPFCDSGEEISCGRFANYLIGQDIDLPLRRQNGEHIQPSEVSLLYGKPDGFKLFENGIDICSEEYFSLKRLPEQLKPIYQDLSELSNWPNPIITPGTLAIDPILGRFALFSGDCPKLSLFSLTGFAYTGFGVPGHGEIKVQDNHAYIASGEGDFQILDISNKNNPKVIGHMGVSFNSFVDVSGNIAYLVKSGGIYTLDISNPCNPCWPNGIPQHPNRGNVPWTPPSGGAVEIKIYDNYAFVTVANSPIGFYILDITNPCHLSEIANLNLGDPHGGAELFIHGNKAYVGISGRPYGQQTPAGGGAVVIDICDPSNPTILGSYRGEFESDVYDTPYLIGYAGDTLIMATQWRAHNYPPERPAELILVDMSNPSDPQKRGVYTFTNQDGQNLYNVYLKRCVSQDNFIYITDSNYDYTQVGMYRTNTPTHLFTFDISNLDNPLLVNMYSQTPSKYRYISLYDQYLFINDYNYGIRIFNATNPSQPEYMGGTITAGEGHWCWINEEANRAYVSQTFGGSIFIIDISSPLTPQVIGTYWDGDWVLNPIKGKNDFLYIPQKSHLGIVNCINPSNPIKIGDCPGLSVNMKNPRIFIKNDLLYVTYTKINTPISGQSTKALTIYNISQPSNPTFISELDVLTSNNASSPQIWVEGDLTYLVCGEEKKLLIVNISNSAYPFILGELHDESFSITAPSRYGGNIIISEDTAYITTGESGTNNVFHIVDVTNPCNPTYVKLHQHHCNFQAQDFHTYENFLIMGSYSKISLFDISDSKNPTFLGDTSRGGIRNASWSSGHIRGNYLYFPSLDGLNILKIPRPSEAITGSISALGNLILNAPPNVVAGSNLMILSEEQTITKINGYASDEDGDPLDYRWLLGDEELITWQSVEPNGEANLNLANIPYFSVGDYILTLEVSDGDFVVNDDMILTINNSPPILAPSGGGVFQVGNDIILGGEMGDFDGDIITYEWVEGTTVLFCGTIDTLFGGDPIALPEDIIICGLSLGTHELILKANDGFNSLVSSTIIAEVIDTTAPSIAPTSNITILWPPNHELVNITINANAWDDSGNVSLEAEITSNELPETDENGNTVPDFYGPWIDQENGIITCQLRAERSGTGDGRTYTITITATDISDNKSTAEVKIIAPHDKRKK